MNKGLQIKSGQRKPNKQALVSAGPNVTNPLIIIVL